MKGIWAQALPSGLKITRASDLWSAIDFVKHGRVGYFEQFFEIGPDLPQRLRNHDFKFCARHLFLYLSQDRYEWSENSPMSEAR